MSVPDLFEEICRLIEKQRAERLAAMRRAGIDTTGITINYEPVLSRLLHDRAQDRMRGAV